MTPLISVIIPTYNRLWALPRSAGQFFDDANVGEIVVVDDGSTDGTREWLVATSFSQPKLKPVYHGGNMGASAARNAGLDCAQCPYVFFWDDDMVLQPKDGLAILLEALQTCDGSMIAPALQFNEGAAIAVMGTRSACKPDVLLNPWLISRRGDSRISKRLPPKTFESFVLPGLSLQSKSLFSSLRFDPGWGRTSYRDESDIQLSVLASGGRLLASPKVCAIDLRRPSGQDGGCHSYGVLLRYELTACRNNWRFLKRHKKTIRDVLHIRTPISLLQLMFLAYHLGYMLPCKTSGAILRRLRRSSTPRLHMRALIF